MAVGITDNVISVADITGVSEKANNPSVVVVVHARRELDRRNCQHSRRRSWQHHPGPRTMHRRSRTCPESVFKIT